MYRKPTPEVTVVTDDYRQVGSFESDVPSAVDTGETVIAFGLDDSVTVVSGSDRTVIEHGSPVVDLAVADRLLVLSPETLTAYSHDGNRVWSHDVDGAYAVAGTEGHERCGVLGANRLRYVELGSGREQFSEERSRTGTRDDEFLATPTGFVIATWSFLTALDTDGNVAFDRDLSAVVRSVGTCNETVIAALQSDRLVGLDAATGTDRWQTELDVSQVALNGTESLLVSTATGVLNVKPNGTTSAVPDLPHGDVYATTDGSVVCSVRDGTIATYVPDRDRVSLAVRTDTVGVGGTIDIEAANPSKSAQTVDLAIDVDGCEFSPSERSVTIDAEDTVVVDFPVSEVHKEGTTGVTVTVDGDGGRRGTVTVNDATSGGLAVETTLRPTAVEDGVAEIAVTVENVGGVPLDSVRLLEAESNAVKIAPGDTWDGSVTRPYEPERRVSVGLEVMRGDRRREYAPTCRLPKVPTIDADTERDALRATVTVHGDVVVSDRLVVEMPGAGRVRSPVTIDGDELLLVVPQYEAGVARIALESLDTEERVRVSGNGTFTTPSSIDAGRDRSRRGKPVTESNGQTDRSRSSGTDQSRDDRRSPTSERSNPTATEGSKSSTTNQPSSPASVPRSDDRSDGANADRRPDPATTEPGGTPVREGSSDVGANGTDDGREPTSDHTDPPTAAASDGASTSNPAPSSESGSISTTRDLPERVPGIGHAVRDQIVVENAGRAGRIAIDDGQRVELGRVEAGERVSVERFVAAGTADELVLPGVTIEIDGAVVQELSEKTLPVARDGIDVSAVVDPEDGSVVASVENNTDDRYWVTAIDSGPNGGRESVSKTVDPGETTTVSSSIRGGFAPGAVVPLSVWVEATDDGERRIDVLAASNRDRGGAANERDEALTASISSDTQVAGEYSSVVLAFENGGRSPLSDLSVVADGDPIDTMFYSPARREVVEPGDRVEHFVDLESGLDEPVFEATITYTVDGEHREYAVRASGPAVGDESMWTDDHLSAWSLDRVEEATEAPTLPTRLSTSFESDS